MAGVKRADAPPETPFLQSKGPALASATPMMPKFTLGKNLNQNAAAAPE